MHLVGLKFTFDVEPIGRKHLSQGIHNKLFAFDFQNFVHLQTS